MSFPAPWMTPDVAAFRDQLRYETNLLVRARLLHPTYASRMVRNAIARARTLFRR